MGIGKKDHLADDLRGLESTPLYFKMLGHVDPEALKIVPRCSC